MGLLSTEVGDHSGIVGTAGFLLFSFECVILKCYTRYKFCRKSTVRPSLARYYFVSYCDS